MPNYIPSKPGAAADANAVKPAANNEAEALENMMQI